MLTMRTIFLALLTILSVTAFGQISVGVHYGLGQSNLRSGKALDLLTDQASPVGVSTLGAFAKIPLTHNITLRPGLNLTRRGGALKLTQDLELFNVPLPLGARAESRFTYLDIPLLAQFNLPTESVLRPYALAGVNLGYATGGKLTTSARALVFDLDVYSTDINLDAINYERFHAAVTAGLGTEIAFGGSTNAFLEARYEHGLTQPYDVPVVEDRVGFQGWTVGAGLAFRLR